METVHQCPSNTDEGEIETGRVTKTDSNTDEGVFVTLLQKLTLTLMK